MVFFWIFYFIICLVDGTFQFGLYQNTVIPIPMLFIAIPVGLYASIVADTDIRTSYAYGLSIVLIIAIIWALVLWKGLQPIIGLGALTLSLIALLLPHHRGFFHTMGFAVLFSFGMTLLFWDYKLGILIFGAGISHVVGDI